MALKRDPSGIRASTIGLDSRCGVLQLICTSDEEGPAVDGTVKVCEWLQARGERLDYCIVGEPTSVDALGDMIKNGRRGTLTRHAHRQRACRAISPTRTWPKTRSTWPRRRWPSWWRSTGTAATTFFPPTSWQMSNIHAGTGASNVIPGDAVIDFNFRFSTEATPESLQGPRARRARPPRPALRTGLDAGRRTLPDADAGQAESKR